MTHEQPQVTATTGLPVGVEDAVTLAYLAELGCDDVQGYHVVRPLSAEELSPLWRAREEASAAHWSSCMPSR